MEVVPVLSYIKSSYSPQMIVRRLSDLAPVVKCTSFCPVVGPGIHVTPEDRSYLILDVKGSPLLEAYLNEIQNRLGRFIRESSLDEFHVCWPFDAKERTLRIKVPGRPWRYETRFLDAETNEEVPSDTVAQPGATVAVKMQLSNIWLDTSDANSKPIHPTWVAKACIVRQAFLDE